MSPEKKTKADAEAYLTAILGGLGPATAAAEIDLSPDDAIKLVDPEKIACAEGVALGLIEGKLFQEASKGKITAMIFWLCNRDPERWKNVASIGRGGEGGELNALENAIREIQDK